MRGVRVHAAMEREEVEVLDLKESSDDHVTSTVMDSDNEVSTRDISHDSHVIDDWVTQLKSSLPQKIDTSCKLTLGLNVDNSPETVAKLTYLLDYLESKLVLHQCMAYFHASSFHPNWRLCEDV